nr:MAG TPA: hypothetical protein [Caudoviricetes sp.]
MIIVYYLFIWLSIIIYGFSDFILHNTGLLLDFQ